MPENLWETTLLSFVLVGVRISMLMVFAPFFGSLAIPARVKIGLTVALTALLFPICRPTGISLSAISLGEVVIGEALAGLFIALSMQLVFEVAQLAGQILGWQMGFSLVQLFDPQTMVDTPVLSMFYQLFCLLTFLSLDVHHWLLRGLVQSFKLAPGGEHLLSAHTVSELMRTAGGMWVAGLQLAAPVLLATMLADLTLGFLSKASPHLPVLLVGISLKSALGLLVLLTGLALWPAFFAHHFENAITTAEHWIRLAS